MNSKPPGTTVGVWLTRKQKGILRAMAFQDDRNISNFVAWLILKEARRRKLIEKPARA